MESGDLFEEDWSGRFNDIVERLRDINLADIDLDNPPPELYEGIEELIPYNEEDDEDYFDECDTEMILDACESTTESFHCII